MSASATSGNKSLEKTLKTDDNIQAIESEIVFMEGTKSLSSGKQGRSEGLKSPKASEIEASSLVNDECKMARLTKMSSGCLENRQTLQGKKFFEFTTLNKNSLRRESNMIHSPVQTRGKANRLEKMKEKDQDIESGNDTQYLLKCEEFKSALKRDSEEHSLENTSEGVSINLQYHKPLHDLTLRESLSLIGHLTKQLRNLSGVQSCARCSLYSEEVENLQEEVKILKKEMAELIEDRSETMENFKRYHEEIITKSKKDYELKLDEKEVEIMKLRDRIKDLTKKKLEIKSGEEIEAGREPEYYCSQRIKPGWPQMKLESLLNGVGQNADQLNNITLADLEEPPQVLVSPKPDSRSRRKTELGFYSDEEMSDFHSYMKDTQDPCRETSQSSLNNLKSRYACSIRPKDKKTADSKLSKEKSKNNTRRKAQIFDKEDAGCSKDSRRDKELKKSFRDSSKPKPRLKSRPTKDYSIVSPSFNTDLSKKIPEQSVVKTQRKKSTKKLPKEASIPLLLKKPLTNKENIKPGWMQLLQNRSKEGRNLLF